MRTKRSGIAIPAYERPQVFDRASLPIWRRYTKLYPYQRGADAAYRSTGMPIMRHALLTHPGDRRAVHSDDQFLFGPDLLAAPVTRPGARTRRLYSPSGTWVDWWFSVSFCSRDGAFVPRRARVLRGKRVHILPAPEDELPLLVRAGAVLPLLSADVDTLSPYDGRGIVRLRDRVGRLTLLAFPRGRWQGRLGAMGRLRAREHRGRWMLRIVARHAQTYTLRAALGSLRRPFNPTRITVAEDRLSRARWRYNRRTRVLTAPFRAPARTTLRVSGAR
jgi:alpha-D-xyloside xylohydrolase